MSKKRFFVCKTCGKEIYDYYRANHIPRKYCSMDCRNKDKDFWVLRAWKKGHVPWNKGKPFMKGKDNPYYGKKHTEEIKEKMRGKRAKNPKLSEIRKRLFKEGKLKSWSKNKNSIEDSRILSGKNHPRWIGGKSFEPYDNNFNSSFKKLIRKRDNYICMLCGIHSEKLSRALSVHHINYDKKLSMPQNCISLCINCHLKTQNNRELWIKLFQNLLEKKYSYQYSEGKEIILNLSEGRQKK